MTALAKDRKTDQFGTPDEVIPALINFPVAAATTLYAGGLGATDAAGRAVPASASTALKVWGRIEKQTINTVAAGFGSAGQLSVDIRRGIFYFSSADIVAADVGKLCYVVDDNNVALSDGAGLRPACGVVQNIRGDGQVAVLVGFPALYSVDDTTPLDSADVRSVRVRNVVNGAIADLTAYTVASNAAVNDAVLNVAGDIVLLVNQAVAANNGLYVVGTVSTGVAPLTRQSTLAVGETILSGQVTVHVGEGTLFRNSTWKNVTNSGVVGTDAINFYPGRVVQEVVLVGGTLTLTNVPILSATKSQFSMNRKTANTCTLTLQYVTNGAATPGVLGTASVAIMAAVAAGTINVADISTLELTIINW